MTTASLAAGSKEPAQKRKIPLYMQMVWLRQELSTMRGHDLVQAARPKPSRNEAHLNHERAQATLATLEWVQQHEADIRAWVEAGRPKAGQP